MWPISILWLFLLLLLLWRLIATLHTIHWIIETQCWQLLLIIIHAVHLLLRLWPLILLLLGLLLGDVDAYRLEVSVRRPHSGITHRRHVHPVRVHVLRRRHGYASVAHGIHLHACVTLCWSLIRRHVVRVHGVLRGRVESATGAGHRLVLRLGVAKHLASDKFEWSTREF